MNQNAKRAVAQHCIIDHSTKLITNEAVAQHRHKITDVTHQPCCSATHHTRASHVSSDVTRQLGQTVVLQMAAHPARRH